MSNLVKWAGAFAAGLGVTTVIAYSQPAPVQNKTPAEIAAEFVVGNCFRSIDDVSRVKSMARVLKWKELAPEIADALKPVDAQGYEGWHVVQDGQNFLVGVNTGTIDGRRVEVCAVVANHAPDVIVPLVLKAVRARFVSRDNQGFQVSETYNLDHPTQSKAMLMIVRAPANENEPPVNFSFMGFR